MFYVANLKYFFRLTLEFKKIDTGILLKNSLLKTESVFLKYSLPVSSS